MSRYLTGPAVLSHSDANDLVLRVKRGDELHPSAVRALADYVEDLQVYVDELEAQCKRAEREAA